MKFKFLTVAMIALVMAGCRFRGSGARSNDGGLVFKDSLADFAQEVANQPSRGQAGRNVYPSDPSLTSGLSTKSALIQERSASGSVLQTQVLDQFETAPLDNFSFDSAGSFREIRLEDAIRMALANAPVVRDLGGLILRAPDATATSVDPSLAYLDPRFGEEAALSAFDACLLYTSDAADE